MDTDMFPNQRTAGLIVTQAGDDTIVFDQRSQYLHTLPPAVANVWVAANGVRGPAEIAAVTGFPLPQILSTLDLLATSHLLTGGPSRRAFMQRGGMVAGAVILSIAVPTAAQAESDSGPTDGQDDIWTDGDSGDDTWGDGWDGADDSWGDGWDGADDSWGDDGWDGVDEWDDGGWGDNP